MKKLFFLLFTLAIVIITIVGSMKLHDIFKNNTIEITDNNQYFYIDENMEYDEFLNSLKESKILVDYESFVSTAKLKKLHARIIPGKYEIKTGMNNNQLVNMFRSGNQSLVNLSFNNIRTKHHLAKVVSSQIMADSASIVDLLDNNNKLEDYGFDTKTIMVVFIPNTYEFYWNTSAKGFLERMLSEYKKFWNEERLSKAEKINMTIVEVSTLASIIDEETTKNLEKKTIAGVYINRLKKGIPLQADPSIKFALQDFFKRRITKKDLEIDSPYNTYKNAGLPPGPIRIPSITAINAVLNYEKHDYYYFCAKEDFSGYHHFAKTLMQHNLNARKYHKALNKNRIYK